MAPPAQAREVSTLVANAAVVDSMSSGCTPTATGKDVPSGQVQNRSSRTSSGGASVVTVASTPGGADVRSGPCTNTSSTELVSPLTRLLAVDDHVVVRPSSLMSAPPASALDWAPAVETL